MNTRRCNVSSVPYCCGVYEAGNFGDAAHYDDGEYFHEDTVEELLEKVLRFCDGQPVLFNFVKRKDWQGTFNKMYDASDLRDLVKNHPNVVHIWKGINSNSNNRIDCYIIKDYKND